MVRSRRGNPCVVALFSSAGIERAVALSKMIYLLAEGEPVVFWVLSPINRMTMFSLNPDHAWRGLKTGRDESRPYRVVVCESENLGTAS
jgi:hypothetical protein